MHIARGERVRIRMAAWLFPPRRLLIFKFPCKETVFIPKGDKMRRRSKNEGLSYSFPVVMFSTFDFSASDCSHSAAETCLNFALFKPLTPYEAKQLSEGCSFLCLLRFALRLNLALYKEIHYAESKRNV